MPNAGWQDDVDVRLRLPVLLSMSCLAAGAHAATASDAKCGQLATGVSGWSDASTRIESATWRANGFEIKSPMGPTTLPAHCEIIGMMREREGVAGQRYAIRFRLRLPENWNQRFFFQGGGGTNGEIGERDRQRSAAGAPNALSRGYAVVSQDSGHDNARNSVARARRRRLPSASILRRVRITAGPRSSPLPTRRRRPSRRSMAASPSGRTSSGVPRGARKAWRSRSAIRKSSTGLSPARPGFSLPRAAVAEAWDTQAFASSDRAGQVRGIDRCREAARHLQSTHSSLACAERCSQACDADDGAATGSPRTGACVRWSRVKPELQSQVCTTSAACLSGAQVDVIESRLLRRGSIARASALYVSWPFDARHWQRWLARMENRPGGWVVPRHQRRHGSAGACRHLHHASDRRARDEVPTAFNYVP